METIACNLCGSENYSLVYKKPDVNFFPDEFFNVVECKNCGLGFLNPRPTLEEIWKYYPHVFYDEFSENREHHLKRYAIEAEYLKEFEDTSTPPLLLDVGCANGDFPRFMQKRGWQVEGVEIATNSEPITDIPIYQLWFPDIPVHEPRYDAITAWAVLEHVHDPKLYFHKAAQVLRPGGLFVFLVPNFSSLASRHLFGEDIPRHLYFFTEQTVESYLNQAGFVLERADYSNKIYEMPPRFWLYYLVASLLKREFTWPLPETYAQFITKRGLPREISSIIKYIAHSPLTLLDKPLLPLIERWEMWKKCYGTVTYVARKK